jgi:hypothetical protein
VTDFFVTRASVFQEPGALAALVDAYAAGRTRDELLRAAGNQEYKDAWQACLLALGYQEWRRVLTEVRICAPDQFPDFQLRIEGRTFDFEATMILSPGRRMGDDYRGDATIGPPPIEHPGGVLPPFDPTLLLGAIRAKAARGYATRPHLLVYCNLDGAGVDHAGLVRLATIPEAASFESIWTIGGKFIGCVKSSEALPAPTMWCRIPIQ